MKAGSSGSSLQFKIITFLWFLLIPQLALISGDETDFPTVQLDAESVKKPYLFGPDELIKLARLEQQIYELILNHVQTKGESFESLRKWRLNYDDTSFKATLPEGVPGFDDGHSPEYIVSGHPTLTYLMMRRYINEFRQILYDFDRADEKCGSDQVYNSSEVCTSTIKPFLQSIDELEKVVRYGWPDETDFEDSISSILKIHDMYDLRAKDIVKGVFHGIDTKIHLQRHHAFEIGRFGTVTNQFVVALDWLQLASRMSNGPVEINETDIQDDIQELVDKHNANWSNGSFQPGPEQLNYFTRQLVNATLLPDVEKIRTVKHLGLKFYKGNRTSQSEMVDYCALCSGENFQTTEELSKLKCWYERKISPELLVFPAKVEQVSSGPSMVKFYDIIGPNVIAKFKELSLQNQYVEVYKSTSDESENPSYSKDRASAASWLNDNFDKSLRLLTRRIESITGLNVFGPEDADEFEVVAYSCGGNFVLHQDALEESKTELRGDRIATMLLYLDNVILGGSTVFPRLGAAIKPEAGTAIFWYNMFSDGSVDESTIHAACPVILGQKWSVNRCITEYGNFLKRKCDPKNRPKSSSKAEQEKV